MKDQVPESIKKERSARLISLQNEIRDELLAEEAGNEYDVLFETYNGAFYTGHSPSFIEISAVSDTSVQGEIRRVRIVESMGGVCFGVLI